MICPKCGAIVTVNDRTCMKCGTPIARSAASKPKPTQAPVSNTLVWILAFVPAIGALFAFGTLVVLAVNIILCVADDRQLSKAGYNTATLGSAWLIPVYLYKRADMLHQGKGYFIVWCVTFGLSFLGFFH